jgi:hypothetical protein
MSEAARTLSESEIAAIADAVAERLIRHRVTERPIEREPDLATVKAKRTRREDIARKVDERLRRAGKKW